MYTKSVRAFKVPNPCSFSFCPEVDDFFKRSSARWFQLCKWAGGRRGEGAQLSTAFSDGLGALLAGQELGYSSTGDWYMDGQTSRTATVRSSKRDRNAVSIMCLPNAGKEMLDCSRSRSLSLRITSSQCGPKFHFQRPVRLATQTHHQCLIQRSTPSEGNAQEEDMGKAPRRSTEGGGSRTETSENEENQALSSPSSAARALSSPSLVAEACLPVLSCPGVVLPVLPRRRFKNRCTMPSYVPHCAHRLADSRRVVS
ncbi:hypothetical protein BDZ88DRAFT_441652 [Geranomyces variabilis]|nr:hypothetical protein BDZ88DRAFT_441652 [Geranomyces variabilis]